MGHGQRQVTIAAKPGSSESSSAAPSSSASNDTWQAPKVKRHLVSAACIPCRMSRNKCSGTAPCSRCATRNLHCTFDEKRDALTAARGETTNYRAALGIIYARLQNREKPSLDDLFEIAGQRGSLRAFRDKIVESDGSTNEDDIGEPFAQLLHRIRTAPEAQVTDLIQRLRVSTNDSDARRVVELDSNSAPVPGNEQPNGGALTSDMLTASGRPPPPLMAKSRTPTHGLSAMLEADLDSLKEWRVEQAVSPVMQGVEWNGRNGWSNGSQPSSLSAGEEVTHFSPTDDETLSQYFRRQCEDAEYQYPV